MLPRRFGAGLHREKNALAALLIWWVPALLLFCAGQLARASSAGVTFGGIMGPVPMNSITLTAPTGVAWDAQGDLFVLDKGSDEIPAQIVEVPAGGPAFQWTITGAALTRPSNIAVDGAGNLYVANSGGANVLKITPEGVSSALALGSQTLSDPTGVALDSAGNLYVSDFTQSKILVFPGSGGAPSHLNISGLSTALSLPQGLAFDAAGNLYIADYGNSRIVKVTPLGAGSQVNITGIPVIDPLEPFDIGIDGSGNLIISDQDTGSFYTVPAGGGAVGYLNTGGEACNPSGIAMNPLGDLVLTDTCAEQKVTSIQDGAVGFGQVQVGANSSAISLPFSVPSNITLGSAAVSDLGVLSTTSGLQRPLDFSLNQTQTTCGAETTNTTCTVSVTSSPQTTGLRQAAVVLYDNSTPPQLVARVPLYSTGIAPAAMVFPGSAQVIPTGETATSGPSQIAIDGNGNLYVANVNGNNVVEIPGGGEPTVVSTGAITLGSVGGVAVDPTGDLYISDEGNSHIVVVTPGGQSSILSISGLSTALFEPLAINFDGAGNLYIADAGNTRIVKISSLAMPGVTSSGKGSVLPTGSITLGSALGVAVDMNNNVYIADKVNSRIVEVPPFGAASVVAFPDGFTLNEPRGVAVDGVGNLYVADAGNSRIVMLTPAGTAQVLALPGLASPSTLGAVLFGVLVDNVGDVFIPDYSNNRIVDLYEGGPNAYTFASTLPEATSSDSPQTWTVWNLGNENMLFTGEDSDPTYLASFPENTADTNLCSLATSLTPGAQCDVSVNFIPQATGSLNGNVAVLTNSYNNPTTIDIPVSGMGLPPDTTVTAVTVSPGAVASGQPVNIIVTVTDTTDNGTMPTGSVTVTDTVGSTTTTLNSGNPVNLTSGVATLSSVTLIGVGTHIIAASYAGVSNLFTSSAGSGAALITTSSNVATAAAAFPVTLTITAAGTVGSINVLTQGAPNLDFTDGVTGDTCSGAYDVGNTCIVNVIFTPAYPGTRYGAVVLEDGSGNALATGYVSGMGIGPVAGFAPGVINTVAGNYVAGYGFGGDGGPATSAQMTYPWGVALDGAGNLYFADEYNYVVRKVTPGGVISTYAGNEALGYGYSGDSGPATSAQFGDPRGIALDGAGNLYIADAGNNVIRMVTPGGAISTVAGNYESGSGYSGDGGQATSAQLSSPSAVALDGAGNLFILDTNNSVVRKETPAGVISTVAGDHALGAGFSGDGSQATSAQLNRPFGLAVDGTGDLYIADSGNNVVREVTPGGAISTVVGSFGSASGYSGDGGPATSAQLNNPYGIALDGAGNFYFADSNNGVIRKVTSSGIISTVAGSYGASILGDGGSATSAKIGYPEAVAIDSTGNLYIPDYDDALVRKVDVSDAPSLTFPNTVVAATSAALDVTLENFGNAALNIGQINPGTNFNTLGADTTCATSSPLASAATCVLGIQFAPVAAGAISGSVTLTDNSLNGSGVQQSISVSGTAQVGGLSLVLPNMFTAGVPQSFTLTAFDANGNAIASGLTDTVSLTSTDPNAVFSLTSGGAPITSYTFTGSGTATLYVTLVTETFAEITDWPPFSQSVTATDGSISATSNSASVNPGPAATISADDESTTLSLPIGSEVGLEVAVDDIYGNVIVGETVNFTVPASGPSLIMLQPSVTVGVYGFGEVPVFANTLAGGPYTVTATAVDLPNSPVTFTITNLPGETSTALTGSPASPIVYGTGVALTATVTPGSSEGGKRVVAAVKAKSLAKAKAMIGAQGTPFGPPVLGPPTGMVQFWDMAGSAAPVLLGTATLVAGTTSNGITPATAAFTVVAPAAGAHTYNAVYIGDPNYSTSFTATAVPYTVTQASVTVSGPAQPVQFAAGQPGSVTITATGSANGTGIASPSGSVSYTILNSSSVSVASGTAILSPAANSSAASIVTPNNLAPGTYTIQVSYLGDGNFTPSSSPVTISFMVAKYPSTISWPQPSAIFYGTSLGAILNATASSGSTAIEGIFTYTATPTGATASAVGPSTVLAAGSYTLTAAFAPTDSSTYAAATQAVSLTVSQAAVTIAWTGTSAAITYPTPLSAEQLNATTTIPGTFVYTPAVGTVLNAGLQTLSVTFTPTDTADYVPVTKTESLVVNQASQSITFAPLASPVNYTSPIALNATGGSSGNPVTFSIVSGPGSISGNELMITGVGTVVVAANQAANVDYSAAAQVTQSVVSVASSLTLNATTFIFGSVPLGSSSPTQTLIISNPNGFAVTGTSIAASGDFSAASNCPAIAALSSCSVNITFTPTASGTRTGNVTVTDAQTIGQLSATLTGSGAAAGIQFSAASLNFGSVVSAASSVGQTITIENTGTADLIISNIATTGDFITTGNCATIPAGSNCSLSVTFTPSALGTRTGTVTFTDNVGGSSQSQVVNLIGLGTQAGAALAPSVETFPGTLVGSTSFPLNVTVANTGTAPLTGIGVSILGDFTQTNTCRGSLAPAVSCTISVEYTPTIGGIESGTLTVIDSLGTQTVSLVGNGVVPGASLSIGQLLFGGQLINTSSLAQTVVLTNTGTSALNIGSVTTTSNFTDTTNCSGSIAPGANCSVNVIFTPSTAGALDGSVTITDSAGAQVVSLEGQGTNAGLSVSPSFVIFGGQVAGSISQAQTLTLTNTGTSALTLNPIAVSNNLTESDQCPGVLQAGASCTISLSFSPTSTGPVSGSLLISDSSALVSTLVTASGEGTLPGIAASPSTVSFGSLPVGTTSQGQTVTVTNTGTSPLAIGTVSGTGDFAETDTCSSQTIAPNSYCVISVTMTPTTVGTRTGIIQFNNSVDGLHQIALNGVGQQAGVSVDPTSLAFGSLPIASATQASSAVGTSLSVIIGNAGSAPLQLGGFTTQGDFSESDNCGSAVAAGATCTLTVKFLPTALGHRTGTLTITDNSGGNSQLVSLAGDGSPAGLFLTPPVIDFGVQPKGVTSKPQSATLSNNTGQSITDLSIIASGEYSETDNCGTALANGASCTLNITVTPATKGAITGTVIISGGGVFATGSPSGRIRNESTGNAPSSATSNVGVVATLADTNGNANAAASQLAFGTTPAPVITAGGSAGSSITVLEDDSNGNAVGATDTITLTVTGPNGFLKTYTATASGGIATFNLGSSTPTVAGVYSYTVTVAANASIKAATAGETVNSGPAASVAATMGSGQSTVTSTAFATPLQVTVKDAYGNPVSGVTVTFAVPGSGASASLSSTSATSNGAGLASVTATANGVVGIYTVTATVAGATAATFSLTNAGAKPVVGVTSNSDISLLESAVTLTATVNSTAGTPTGTVNFLDGTTQLGSAPLSEGVATFTTSSLAAGSHVISAVYSGDPIFVTATSSTLSLTILDYAVSAVNGSTKTVVPGGSAAFTVDVAPTQGSTLPAAATLTVTGLPGGAKATLTATSWTQLTGISWQLPANTAMGDVSLTFETQAQTAGTSAPDAPRRTIPQVVWSVLLLPFARRLRRIGKRMSRKVLLMLLLAAGMAATAGLGGCGSSNGFFGQPQSSYNVTVTVTAGSLSHSTNLTLNVQ